MKIAGCIAITGASSGLGAALAIALAASGNVLALTGRNPDRLQAVAEACQNKGATCRIDVVDLRDPEAALAWVDAVDRATPIGMMIVNAGVAGTRVDLETGERQADMIVQAQTNFTASLVVAQASAQRQRRRGRGHLVLISSLNGLFPVAEAPTYSATKAGILAYGRAVRDWLEPAGVAVTTVAPGFIRTGIAERYQGRRPFEMTAEAAAERIISGLERGARDLAFPWPLVAGVHASRLVPNSLRRWVVGRFPARLPPLE